MNTEIIITYETVAVIFLAAIILALLVCRVVVAEAKESAWKNKYRVEKKLSVATALALVAIATFHTKKYLDTKDVFFGLVAVFLLFVAIININYPQKNPQKNPKKIPQKKSKSKARD